MSTQYQYLQTLIECKNHGVSGEKMVMLEQAQQQQEIVISEHVDWGCRMALLELSYASHPEMSNYIAEEISSRDAYVLVFGEELLEDNYGKGILVKRKGSKVKPKTQGVAQMKASPKYDKGHRPKIKGTPRGPNPTPNIGAHLNDPKKLDANLKALSGKQVALGILTVAGVTALAYALYRKVKKSRGEAQANREAAKLSAKLSRAAKAQGKTAAARKAKQNAIRYSRKKAA